MKLYCPVCLNQTLKIASKGIVQVSMNHKQLATSRFLYNLDVDTPEDIYNYFVKHFEDLFSWYASFKNKSPITSIEVWSSSFQCANDCQLPNGLKLNVSDLLISHSQLKKLIEELALKYQLVLAIPTP
jgi:hypothetical protein